MEYEALYKNGQIQWLTEPPLVKSARIKILILEDTTEKIQKRRQPSSVIAGKGKTIGDLINIIDD
jgi:hypothetical protein